MQNDAARIGATGASFGAFHAANAVFRRPDLFDTLIAMSGFYDLGPSYLFGFGNDDIYFNNPTSYLPGIERPHAAPARTTARSTSAAARARTSGRTTRAS